MDYREIEVRFLEINKDLLISRLREIGAEDLGEDFLREMIFYDKDGKWLENRRQMVRIRATKRGTYLTYKNQYEDSATGTEEIELQITDPEKVEVLLDRLGYPMYRKQEKRRHTFKFEEVIVDIDTWPRVPTYVELEGPSEDALKAVSAKLNLDWQKAVFENPRIVIEKYYHIPVSKLRYFTFDRVE